MSKLGSSNNPAKRVTLEQAFIIVGSAIRDNVSHTYLLSSPASMAYIIWPGHAFTAQGAGGAAARMLKRMHKYGWTEEWHTEFGTRYYLTTQGRSQLQALTGKAASNGNVPDNR